MENKSVHQSFGLNLLYLCVRHGSIAKTCNDLALNRQQFNKYLAGASFPSSTTLAKIATLFEISERDLFADPEEFILKHSEAQNLKRQKSVLNNATRHLKLLD